MKVRISKRVSLWIANFISHMVQMKVAVIPDDASVEIQALYPTWFRWKFLHIKLCEMPTVLYIPHGSDESQKIYQTLRIVWLTLYPTWFRWKRIHNQNYHSFNILYIPHGSDESLIKRYQEKPYITFISHMVQMKDEWKSISSRPPIPLYPTWFRWKTNTSSNPPLKSKLYIPHGSDESPLQMPRA